ncbi:PrpF domain-containing protein, partial [Escherichia sp. HC-CC4]
PRADVDYLFAQVIVHEQRVDTTPNCGNMLSGVGAFAIENGLIAATSPVTRVLMSIICLLKLLSMSNVSIPRLIV